MCRFLDLTQMDLAERIGELCISSLGKLPSSVKPDENKQWTVFSAIVEEKDSEIKVISMGTGTKCLGANLLSPEGMKLNDSHAEVMCRRGFIRYLIHQLKTLEKSKIIEFDESGKFRIKDGVKFHFFTTHPPCGDATIFKMDQEPLSKRQKLDDQDSFTGAKIINNPKEDILAQDEGFIRTKPGRGDRTLSVSCSDKLAKWAILGLQGAFLGEIFGPVYLNSLIFHKNCDFDKEALERALWQRFTTNPDYFYEKYKLNIPSIHSSSVLFPFSKEIDKTPSPTSVIWIDSVSERNLEVAVEGRRQGATKKNLNKRSGRLSICKLELFQEYINLIEDEPHIKTIFSNISNVESLSYRQLKMECKNYQKAWTYLKDSYFKTWTKKPNNLLDFHANS